MLWLEELGKVKCTEMNKWISEEEFWGGSWSLTHKHSSSIKTLEIWKSTQKNGEALVVLLPAQKPLCCTQLLITTSCIKCLQTLKVLKVTRDFLILHTRFSLIATIDGAADLELMSAEVLTCWPCWLWSLNWTHHRYILFWQFNGALKGPNTNDFCHC